MDRLGGTLAPLDLPVDRPAPSLQTFSGAWIHATIASALRPKLKALADEAGATTFLALLAAYQTVLHSVQRPRSNRRRAATSGRTERVREHRRRFRESRRAPCGLLRVRVVPRDTERRQAVSSRAFEHQDYPFFRLVQR